jgi:hypothetical protein
MSSCMRSGSKCRVGRAQHVTASVDEPHALLGEGLLHPLHAMVAPLRTSSSISPFLTCRAPRRPPERRAPRRRGRPGRRRSGRRHRDTAERDRQPIVPVRLRPGVGVRPREHRMPTGSARRRRAPCRRDEQTTPLFRHPEQDVAGDARFLVGVGGDVAVSRDRRGRARLSCGCGPSAIEKRIGA